ncbi:hypothetical protein LX36DRAFT_669395 [Colletotrichum falcatum]|nr:hypothetical protein LX36DRAFT_669395 [Colletotrichum falcatum]
MELAVHALSLREEVALLIAGAEDGLSGEAWSSKGTGERAGSRASTKAIRQSSPDTEATDPTMGLNPYLLAADNPAALLTLLRENPAIASGQDEHGYSLVHAAASYNHLDLLRALVREFGVNVDLRDEDDETALFVVETVDAAKCLVEELGADIAAKGADGITASQKIEAEADYPEVAEYLKGVDSQRSADAAAAAAAAVAGATEGNAKPATATIAGPAAPPVEMPPLPEGLAVTLGTMDQADEVPSEVDPEFKRRIEQLAEREDFHTPEGQAELRRLVEDAVLDQGLGDERSVRQKQA